MLEWLYHLDFDKFTGPVSALVITLVVIFFQRKDLKDNNKDNAKREAEHREDIKVLTATFQSVIDKITSAAENTEKFCEERYKLVLEQLLIAKGSRNELKDDLHPLERGDIPKS